MVKRWLVRWRFSDERRVQTAMVLARDAMHARERVWLMHVEMRALRRQIEFISVSVMELE